MSPSATAAPPVSGRIGLFGGTFDPPHIGHLLTGQSIAERRKLDQIWYVVANDPWQKSGDRSVTPAAIRLAMVQETCFWSRHPEFESRACDIEIRAGGPSYTADTLRSLSSVHRDAEFEVIVGSDAAAQLHTWQDSDWLSEHATFVVVQRGGQPAQAAPGFRVCAVEAPLLEVSSTEIRARTRRGLPITHMVPGPVAAVIEAHNLYREAS
ncbi:MAG: nicotinate (nicotinamide) nucleotide adenylyltransferase [Acidimicrobiales bacterium]|nr:nicotinate (nicotinamide) nucleotide adenylyltransferase [Acidimicrobiales bacterium]